MIWKPITLLLLTAGAVSVALGLMPRETCRNDVCVHARKADGTTVLTAVNGFAHAPIAFSLDLSSRGVAVRRIEAPVTLAPGERRTVAALSPRDADWTYSYEYLWRPGPHAARHDRNAIYRLPVPAGRRFHVAQSCNGRFTHHGKDRYAIDLGMPPGTPVHAARAGRVIDAVDGFGPGKPDPGYRDRANAVRVLHADGTIGLYTHLRAGGVAVGVGDEVAAGDVVGYSGNSGFSAGPHLHFEVYTLDRDLDRRTIKVRYRTERGVERCPEAGRKTGLPNGP